MKALTALALALLAALTALRLWAAAVVPVSPAEAYHWMCARHLDWAFFDGPGGTAAFTHLGEDAFGDGGFGLRVAFPFFAAVASLGAYCLARALFNPGAGLWATIALNALPAFNTAAFHVGPEMPALAFTLLAAAALVRALDHGARWWVLTGLFVAAAVQFSYVAALLPVGALVICAALPRHRVEWRRPGLYLALGLVAASLFPAIAWNQAHDWPARSLGTWHTELTPQWSAAGSALLASIAFLSLPAVAAGLFTLARLIRSARLHSRPRLVLGLAAPFLLFWLRGILHGEPGTGALLPATAILSAGAAAIFLETRAFRLAGAATLTLAAACTARSPVEKGDAWNELSIAVEKVLVDAQSPRSDPLFVIAATPDATATLNYHLSRTQRGGWHDIFLRESQDLSNQFGLWPRYDNFVDSEKPADEFFKLEGNAKNLYVGKSALYLTDEEPDDLPQTITGAFRRVTPYAALASPDHRKMRVYLCEDYQTMPL